MASGRPWRKGRRTVTLSGAGVSVVILALTAASVSMANPQPTLAEVQKQVDALYGEVEVATERYNGAKGRLTEVQRRVATAQANAHRQQTRVTELTKDIGGFAAASYRTGSIDPLIQVFLAADHNEFLAQAAVADAYASQQVGALHILATERQRLEEERAVASEVLERLKVIERDLNRYKTSIEGKLAKAQQLLSMLRAEDRSRVERGGSTARLPAPTLPQTAATLPPTDLSAMSPPTSSPPTGWISVESHGASPNDLGDDTKAIQAAFDTAASTGKGITFPSGAFHVNGTLDIPNALTHIQMNPQTVLKQYGDPKFGTLSKRGSIGASYSISPAARNATTINFTNTSGIGVGTWLVLQSDDSFSGTKPMQPGHLRKVVSISGNKVTIDRPLNRALTSAPKVHVANLAAPVTITGGIAEHNSKLDNFYPAVSLHYVENPVVKMEIRNHGSAGVNPSGTVGGHFDLRVHDLVDDGHGKRFGRGAHQGYGVSATGPTRDLRVTGECWAVRHCFTTNAAYWVITDALKGHGDPEHIVVSMNVHDTTSTGLDTHEPGWNISFSGSTVTSPGRYRAEGSTDGKEGGSGVFVRARGTRVEDVTINGAMDDGITIARPAPEGTPWLSEEYPVIRDARVVNGQGTNAIAAYQPVGIGGGVVIESRQSVGIRVDSGARGTVINGVDINLLGMSGGRHILGEEHATVSNVTRR